MSEPRRYSGLDRLLSGLDQALKTTAGSTGHAERATPGEGLEGGRLTAGQSGHATGLMRVNHSGEVCAQALYQGQALTARSTEVRDALAQAAREEEDHLAWCGERLAELHASPSRLNPLWYGLSVAMGALAGAAGDRWSLGFVAETERQVGEHLGEHIEQLPEQDDKSRAILQQMQIDEAAHRTTAMEAGGAPLPEPVPRAMSLVAKVMKRISYRL